MSVRMNWGMICPACSGDDELIVTFTGDAKLYADGSDDVGDHTWDDNSSCRCGSCDWSGTVAGTRAAAEVASKLESAGWYFEADENEWRKPDADASDGYVYANTLSEAVRQEVESHG